MADFTPISRYYPRSISPYSRVQPFTYRDGRTFIEVLSELRQFIETIVIPYIDDNIETLVDDFNEIVEAIIVELNETIDNVNALQALYQQLYENVQQIAAAVAQDASDASDAADIATQAALDALEAVQRVEGVVDENGKLHPDALPDDGLAAKINEAGPVRSALDAALVDNIVEDGPARSALDAALVDNIVEDGPARSALDAAILQSITTPTDIARVVERPNIEIVQSLKARVAALENRAKRNPVRVVRLANAIDDPTPTIFAGMTAEMTEVDGRPAWRIAGTTGPTRLDMALPEQLDAGPVSAVSAWVYLPDLSNITSVTLSIRGDGATWTRKHDQTGTNFSNLADKSLRQGWNLIRFTPIAAEVWRTVQSPSSFNLAVTKVTEGAPAVAYVHAVDLEVREKATALIVCDWGSKPFYDNAYPDMKSRGWPVIWAPRSERFGEANYPDNMTTLAEVKTLMADGNNNEVSFHSPRGGPTSGLSPEEQRAEVLDALVGLKVHGVYTDGAIWRAAWTQNLAPNAWAANDLFVAAATPNDRYHSGPWPALDRYDIPRSGTIRGYGTTYNMDSFLGTHGFDVFYTHGVIPDSEHTPGNHAKQSEWDALVADMDVAVAAGRLEVLNFGQVLDRYPLERHLDEPLIFVDAPAYTPAP